MRCSRTRRILGVTVTAILLASCSSMSCSSSTKIKYIQHSASTKVKLADGLIVTAPSGMHFMLYLINCIDNSTRDESIFFTTNKLKDFNNQETVVDPTITKLVAAGGTATKIGQVLLKLPGPPEDAFENLLYASEGTESVLMVNQTPLGAQFGPAFFIVDQIDLVNATSSPFVASDPCADQGTYHQ